MKAVAASDTKPNEIDVGLKQASQTEMLGSPSATRPDAIEAPTAPEEGAPYGPRSEILPDSGSARERQGISGTIQTMAIGTVLAFLGFGVLILLVIALSLVGLGAVMRRSVRVFRRRPSR